MCSCNVWMMCIFTFLLLLLKRFVTRPEVFFCFFAKTHRITYASSALHPPPQKTKTKNTFHINFIWKHCESWIADISWLKGDRMQQLFLKRLVLEEELQRFLEQVPAYNCTPIAMWHVPATKYFSIASWSRAEKPDWLFIIFFFWNEFSPDSNLQFVRMEVKTWRFQSRDRCVCVRVKMWTWCKISREDASWICTSAF